MRILQVAHALPPANFGGTELYTCDLARALAGTGHEVAVAAPQSDRADGGYPGEVDGATLGGTEIDVAGVDEFEVVPLPGPRSIGVQDDRALPLGPIDPSVDARFVEALDRFEPDVVHLQHFKGLSATIPSLCAARGVACLATLHDFWPICHREQLSRPDGRRCSGPTSVEKCTVCYLESVDPIRGVGGPAPGDAGLYGDEWSDGAWQYYADAVVLRRTQLRRALAATDKLIAPSTFLRGVFVEHGVAPDSIVHRRNGIEVDRFQDSGFDPDAPLRVGYAGRIAPEKGVHLLLDALPAVAGDVADATLSVFGRFDPDGDGYHAYLADRVDSAECADSADLAADRVHFHGRYDDRAEPYREMDVLVLPSTWYENSPLVIQEAFASGVPAVVGDVGGMAELVTDGVDGLTFTAGDPGALAGVLSRLARDPDLVRRLRDGVEAPKRLDEHVEELVELYETCVADVADAAPAAEDP